jgi:hypothetical protein
MDTNVRYALKYLLSTKDFSALSMDECNDLRRALNGYINVNQPMYRIYPTAIYHFPGDPPPAEWVSQMVWVDRAEKYPVSKTLASTHPYPDGRFYFQLVDGAFQVIDATKHVPKQDDIYISLWLSVDPLIRQNYIRRLPSVTPAILKEIEAAQKRSAKAKESALKRRNKDS